jgi:osmotically-inducible protein OsmY
MHNFKLNPKTAFMVSSALVLVGGLPIQASDLDSRIESSAKNSYNFKTHLKDDNIKVESSKGVVTLTGTVSYDYHKSLAEETVSGLPGVKSVINQLSVVGDQPSDHSDGWITLKVKGALAFRKNVSAKDTEVHTQNGVVTLTGSADSDAHKQLTGEYAKDVEGVTEVRNELVVSKPEKPHRTLGEKVDDISITAQIKTALILHKSTHPVDTKVSTKNGVVSLRGEAKNEAERELVTKLAYDIEGVKYVKNRMTVK